MSTEIVAGGFEDTAPVVQDVGALSAVAREQSEMQAAVISAKKFPRNEAGAYTRIIKAMERPAMAEDAAYRFPRGGKDVAGPSVRLARECARCWGNIRYGVRIVSIDDDSVHIKGFALDLETNAYVESEAKFAKKIQRRNKQTGITQWIEPDERDLRELVNKHGAIACRNALLQILPSDVVEDAMSKAVDTCRKVAAGELKGNRDQTVKNLALAFDEFAVSVEMLEKSLGHPLSAITPEEVTELKGIYKSMRDGHTKREDHFEFVSDKAVDDVNTKLTERKKQNA